MTWQKRARTLMAVAAVAVAVSVAFTLKRRPGGSTPVPVARTDPKAIVESTGGRVMRFNRAHEQVRLEYERQLTYSDHSTKLLGVTVTTDDRGGRSFIVKGKEGDVADGEAAYSLHGGVTLAASDGLTARAEHARYTNDGIVTAPGPVEFADTRLSGSGIGMRYDNNADVLTILDKAVLHIAADPKGVGAAQIGAGVAFVGRREKIVRFERGVRVERSGQVIEADNGVAHLTPDEKRVDTLELHGGGHIASTAPMPGGLQQLTGHDITLQYAADGQALQHAVVNGDAVIQLAGGAGKAGRQITANTVDIVLGPDGSTPTALTARDAVQLTLPADASVPARTVRSTTLDAKGEPGRGLTRAQFAGNVEYREKSVTTDRLARSARLDVALKPALSAFEQATFAGNARFADGMMLGTAATLRYLVDAGGLELTGSEPAIPEPHVSNDQIAVDATKIDVTLSGPVLKAIGKVESVLQPSKKTAPKSGSTGDTKLPSMLKQNEPVNVIATELAYDGAASKATYTGAAQLWQSETSIKADSIVIDDKTGDLAAAGSVATTTMLEQVDKNQQKERVRSIGTGKDFKYEDSSRRATYTGDAHLTGPQGDLTAEKIELYLKPSGDELERAEAYEKMTLREQNRKTTGSRMTYTSANETYVATGTPVTIVDECGRETIGATLTFVKGTDTIIVDGNERGGRTQTKGGEKCQ